MDGLFSIIWVAIMVVAIVNSVNKKGKKAPKRTSSSPFNMPSIEQLEDLLTQQMGTSAPAAQPKPAPAKPAQVKPPRPVTQPAVATPQVHTHLAPDCDIDAPSGSMDFISTEGVDPCHDEDLPSRAAPRPSFPVAQEQPGLALEWTGDALVRSVIMQEILTRPSQRQRR